MNIYRLLKHELKHELELRGLETNGTRAISENSSERTVELSIESDNSQGNSVPNRDSVQSDVNQSELESNVPNVESIREDVQQQHIDIIEPISNIIVDNNESVSENDVPFVEINRENEQQQHIKSSSNPSAQSDSINFDNSFRPAENEQVDYEILPGLRLKSELIYSHKEQQFYKKNKMLKNGFCYAKCRYKSCSCSGYYDAKNGPRFVCTFY